jgi:flagellar biosynthesis anti-sigma factor FlgM
MAPKQSNQVSAGNVTDIADARQSKDAVGSVENSTNAKNRRFDKEKVAKLKAAIADGSYQIDASRIADKFIEHERN